MASQTLYGMMEVRWFMIRDLWIAWELHFPSITQIREKVVWMLMQVDISAVSKPAADTIRAILLPAECL